MTEEQKHFTEHYLLYAYYKVDGLRVPTLEEANPRIKQHYAPIKRKHSWFADKLKLFSIAVAPPKPTPRKLHKTIRDADLRGISQSLHQRSASMNGLKNSKNKGHSRMPSLSGMLSTAKRVSLQRRGSAETVNPSASPYDLIPVEIGDNSSCVRRWPRYA
ncbi:hypothetical protein D6C82_09866 [Aureobasidium pullulans]|nr:hypothetical protein D6C82_09866 [Aureobasidium pullulans]